MLSRRNIRVKVMQAIYALESMSDPAQTDGMKFLKKNLEQARQLFTYLAFFITEVARFAEADAAKKAHKHLPTKEDLNVNTRIAGNEVIWTLLESPSFKKAVNDYKVESILDISLIRRVYQALVLSEDYNTYIRIEQREKKSEKKILEIIFNDLMLANPDFISHIEEHFINWDDDADMMVVLMNNFFQKPAAFDFGEMLTTEKWDFARNLLESVIERKEY